MLTIADRTYTSRLILGTGFPTLELLETAIAASGAPGDLRGIAAAVDGEVVPRGEWDLVELADGARVEVLTAIQGG